MTMFQEIRKAIQGLWSLLVGLKITGHAFFQKQSTVHYPRKTVPNLATYRGHIELVGREDAPGTPKCISCYKCAVGCPSNCISLSCPEDQPSAKTRAQVVPGPLGQDPAFRLTPFKVPPPEGVGAPSKRNPATFHLDYNYCSLCGLCVQHCPVGSLRFSEDVYLAGFTKQEFEYDLLTRLRGQARNS
jgi:NADH-quinone oxidoreductase subunit I